MSRMRSGEILAALLLIGLGLVFLLGNLGLLSVNWRLLWPVLIIIFGGWLIWRAMSRGPGFPTGAYSSGFGDFRPDLTGREIRAAEFSHIFGDVDLDLTRAVFPEGESSVRASHGMGELTIIVPRDLAVRARASAGLGDVSVLDKRSDGIAAAASFESEDYASAACRLNLEASVGVGEVKVMRSG